MERRIQIAASLVILCLALCLTLVSSALAQGSGRPSKTKTVEPTTPPELVRWLEDLEAKVARLEKEAAAAKQVTKPPAAAQDQAWEYRAVFFSAGQEAGTSKLNELAQDGWEYVGPLANGLVAFRKKAGAAPKK